MCHHQTCPPNPTLPQNRTQPALEHFQCSFNVSKCDQSLTSSSFQSSAFQTWLNTIESSQGQNEPLKLQCVQNSPGGLMKTGCWAVFPSLPNSVSLGWKRKMFISHQFLLAILMLAQVPNLSPLYVVEMAVKPGMQSSAHPCLQHSSHGNLSTAQLSHPSSVEKPPKVLH